MDMPPMMPLPPSDPKFYTSEFEHRKGKKHLGTIVSDGVLSDIAVSLGLLFTLLFRLVTLPIRLPARLWVRHRAKNATR